MQESLFIQFIMALWPKLSLYVNTKVNNGQPMTYLHKTMLTPVYSADQKWEGTSANTVYVAADMVAMDSPLPVKKRDSVSTSNGKLPKIGMEKKKGETDINTLNIMNAQYQALVAGGNQAAAASQRQRIIQRFADDVVYCSVGIDEKNEANFLTALADGVMAVPDEENTGTALRVKFGYDKFPQNHFGVEVLNHIGREDIERVLAKANEDGVTITTIAIALSTYREMKKERWARELVADAKDITYTDSTKLPIPNATAFDEAFATEFGGIQFLKIDRTVYFEKNGKRTPVKPFNADKLVFLSSTMVGSLVWGTLAEVTNPVAGVKYQILDQYKLISEFSTTKPLIEHTTGEALVIPVIENVDQIYTIDKTNAFVVDTDAETEDSGDTYTTINGKKFVKSEAIAGLNALGANLPANATDDAVVKAVNALSDKDEAKFFKNVIYLPKLTPDSLSFTKAADSTGKTVKVDSNDKTNMATATATTTDAWITPTISNGVVTVKVAANSEASAPKRTGSVTVTVGEKSSTIAVEQAANA